jgi:hypothetical protein
VSIAVWALAQITTSDFGISLPLKDQMIFLAAPFLAYNFIKLPPSVFDKVPQTSSNFILIAFVLLSFLLLIMTVFFLPIESQLILFLTLVLVMLYCLPLPGFKINFRGLKGMKIHLVAMSWTLTAVFLPLSIAGENLTFLSCVYAFQRYLFVVVATLPFEIRDLKSDDPNLSTWPQKWGIKRTKIIGIAMLFVFFGIEFFYTISSHLSSTLVAVFVLSMLLLYSKTEQSKYFSSFWVESIPILWLFLRGLNLVI